MAVLTEDRILAAYDALELHTLESLDRLKVAELRTLLAPIMSTSDLRQRKPVVIAKALELKETHIANKLQVAKAALEELELRDRIKAQELGSKAERSEDFNNVDTIAGDIVSRINGLIGEALRHSRKGESGMFDMIAAVYELVDDIYLKESVTYSSMSIISRASELRKALAAYKPEPAVDISEQRLARNIDAFIQAYQRRVTPLTKARDTAYRAKVNEANRDLVELPEGHLDWARSILAEVETQTDWRPISAALAICTGRRHGEIHSSGSFEPAGDHSVIFKGQLKDSRDKPKAGGYKIPVLTEPERVLTGIKRLEALGKRYPTHQQAHSALSRQTSAWVFASEYGNKGVKRPKGEAFVYHDYRKIYAFEATRMFKPENTTLEAYTADILGHDPDFSSHITKAYVKYMRALGLE